MTTIEKQFYRIFWKNEICQNLFLLNKEELLDTHVIGTGDSLLSYSTNRIIISNALSNDASLRSVQSRSEILYIGVNDILSSKFDTLKPIFDDIFNERVKLPQEKLLYDFNYRKLRFIVKLKNALFNQEDIEKNIISLLQEYGFVRQGLNTFNEIKESINRFLLPDKNKLINEKTVEALFEVLKAIKDLYVNNSYKKLYETNQILRNDLMGVEDYNSKIELFDELLTAGVINYSKEDSFVECTHCDHLAYKGVLLLRLSPANLKKLKCPICSNELTYFVPYDLNLEIYNIVKKKDGLLLGALCNILNDNDLNYSTNENFLEDIELDCIIDQDNVKYLLELKMYKLNTSLEKLKSKVRKHFGKLKEKTIRLLELPEFNQKEAAPILLINLQDLDFITGMEEELNSDERNHDGPKIRIMNLKFFFNKFNENLN